jgi:hypothetical protein
LDSTSRLNYTPCSSISKNAGLILRASTTAAASSGPTKRLEHAFFRARRISVTRELRLVVIWARDNRKQLCKSGEVGAPDCRFDRLFDAVVSRNEGGVDASHLLGARSRSQPLAPQARSPAGIVMSGRRPLIKGFLSAMLGSWVRSCLRPFARRLNFAGPDVVR